jgi:Putative zinc-finger
MTLLTCAAVERRLAAYHDGELSVDDMVSVQCHLQHCPPCAGELGELRLVREAVRQAAAPAPADDWTGLQPGVMSRMRAEASESLRARVGRVFEDMHLVWIGLGATAATLVCGVVALGMLSFASPEQDNSLAGVIIATTVPGGSNRNPVWLNDSMSVPSVASSEHDVINAAFSGSPGQDSLVVPLTVVVTREGFVQDVSVLSDDHGHQDVSGILNAIARTRLEPALSGGSPIAVGFVWLVAHQVVRPHASS